VPDGRDACPDTHPGDVVDARGCSVCPCNGPAFGIAWSTRMDYIRCVRTAAASLDRARREAAYVFAHRSSCGRPGLTRCRQYHDRLASDGRCRIVQHGTCAALASLARGLDMGPGSCAPMACGR